MTAAKFASILLGFYLFPGQALGVEAWERASQGPNDLTPQRPTPGLPPVTQPPAPIAFDEWREAARTEGGTEYVVTFPSPVVSPHPANNVVEMRVLLPEEAPGPVPVVLILHYWGATDLRGERSMAAELNRKGIAAALLTLPYHLSRTPPGVRSGDLAIEPDPARLRATMTQSVLDSRRALDFLLARPEIRPDRVGVMGTSLGALMAALLYGVEPRVSHAAFLLGGADLAGVLWSSTRVVRQREVLRKRGYTLARLRRELEPVEPLSFLPRSAPGSTFLVGARYDTVVPPVSTGALARALPGAKRLTLDTGHYGGIFVQRRVLREIGRYFEAEFGGQPFEPPRRIVAPTIRLAARMDPSEGLDLGLGLDLVRFDPRGDGIATLLVTPRGPGVFLGRRIRSGLSAGLTLSFRRVGLALLWSVVL